MNYSLIICTTLSHLRTYTRQVYYKGVNFEDIVAGLWNLTYPTPTTTYLFAFSQRVIRSQKIINNKVMKFLTGYGDILE